MSSLLSAPVAPAVILPQAAISAETTENPLAPFFEIGGSNRIVLKRFWHEAYMALEHYSAPDRRVVSTACAQKTSSQVAAISDLDKMPLLEKVEFLRGCTADQRREFLKTTENITSVLAGVIAIGAKPQNDCDRQSLIYLLGADLQNRKKLALASYRQISAAHESRNFEADGHISLRQGINLKVITAALIIEALRAVPEARNALVKFTLLLNNKAMRRDTLWRFARKNLQSAALEAIFPEDLRSYDFGRLCSGRYLSKLASTSNQTKPEALLFSGEGIPFSSSCALAHRVTGPAIFKKFKLANLIYRLSAAQDSAENWLYSGREVLEGAKALLTGTAPSYETPPAQGQLIYWKIPGFDNKIFKGVVETVKPQHLELIQLQYSTDEGRTWSAGIDTRLGREIKIALDLESLTTGTLA